MVPLRLVHDPTATPILLRLVTLRARFIACVLWRRVARNNPGCPERRVPNSHQYAVGQVIRGTAMFFPSAKRGYAHTRCVVAWH